MGKKGKNRGGQNVRIIRIKKQGTGYEPPGRRRSHSTSSEDGQQKRSADLFQGYGAVDLSEKENMTSNTRRSDDARVAASSNQKAAVPVTRPKGLTNLGNTCYFNSVLQVLSQTRLLLEIMAQISADGCEWEAIHVKKLHPNIHQKEQQQQLQSHEGAVPKDEPDDDDNDNEKTGDGGSSSMSDVPENLIVSLPPAFEIFNCFTDSLREIRSSSGSTVFTPNRLLNSIGRKSCQFRGREQQDSHELLRTLLDMIRMDEVRRKRKSVLTCLGVSDVKNVDDDTKAKVKSYAASCNFTTIDSLFGGFILSTVRCEECDSTSQIFEQFYDLSLPISEGHPLPHAHPAASSGVAAAGSSNNNKNNHNASNQHNNNSGNRRGWEKKNKTTSNSTAIPLPGAADAGVAAAPEDKDKKSESSQKDTGKSIQVPGTGSANSGNKSGSSNTVKNRKQVRAEKKAVRRAVKQEKRKQEKQAAASVKAVVTGTEETGADFSEHSQLKDVTDARPNSNAIEDKEGEDDGNEAKEGRMGNHSDTDEAEFDIGEIVPLFSDLGISQGNHSEKDEDVRDESLLPDATAPPHPPDAAEAGMTTTTTTTAAAAEAAASSLSSSGRKDHCEGCDSNSNFRIDMSYSMNASQKNLDVRLQIETRNECNVNLAINHMTASGNRSTSFECSLKAENASDAVDHQSQQQQQQQREAKAGEKGQFKDEERAPKDDDPSLLLDPAVSEVASDNDDDQEKDEDRISSLSGGRGDEEDEGVDEDSDAASSTRAMIDDQDMDDQMNLLAIDESLDDWGENSIEQFTVRGDGHDEPFEDLEPPDVMDDDPLLLLTDPSCDHHHPPLLSQLPEVHSQQLPQQQDPPDPDPIPADSAEASTAAAATSSDITASAIIPPQGAQNDLMKPLTESSCASPATTDDVIRRIRITSESVAAVKRKVNWTLKTAEPSFTVSEKHPEVPSIESCLSVFTLPELLTGSNKLSCENCSRNHRQKETGTPHLAPGAKECKVFSNASKQMLIAYPPIILTLHLKRFYAEGYGQMHLRKINRHVRFPFILNLAPWVSQMYKKMGQEMGVNEEGCGTTLSYRLYGLVEHSGTLRSGHYTAMIRVRRKQHKESHDDDSKAMRAKYLRMKPFISSVESFLDSLHDLDHPPPPPAATASPQMGGEQQKHVNTDDNNDTDSGAACTTSNHHQQELQLSDDQKRLQSEWIDTAAGCSATSVNNNGNTCKGNHHNNADMNRKRDEKRETSDEKEVDDADDKWFYVSDSHVAPTTRESVLNAQAYILFYERI